MRKYTRYIAFVAVACCAVAVFMAISGSYTPAPTDPTIPPSEILKSFDWDLHGVWITADGMTGEELDFTASGTVTVRLEEKWDHVKIQYGFPEAFNYLCNFNNDPDYYDVSGLRAVYDVDYFGATCFSYDRVEDELITQRYALDLVKEYFVIQWSSDPNLYLVASTDPDVDPSSIMEHFELFIEKVNLPG